MRWTAAAALLLAGCDALLGKTTHSCAATGEFTEPYLCPGGYACSPAPTYCGAPDPNVDACDSRGEHDGCMTEDKTAGVCITHMDTNLRTCTPCSADIAWCKVSGWNALAVPNGYQFGSIWVSGIADAYLGVKVGSDGVALFQYNGLGWTPFSPQPMVTQGSTVSSIWGTGSDLYLACGFQLWHFDGAKWTDLAPTIKLNAVWGANGIVFGAADGGGVTYYDGAWHNTTTTITGWLAPKYLGVWADASDAYAVGSVSNTSNQTQGAIAHYSGGTWSSAATLYGSVLRAAWGASVAYAVGDGSPFVTAIELMPAGTTPIPGTGALPSSNLSTIWGSGPTDVYTGGMGGIVLHYDGASTWTNVGPVPTSPNVLQLGGNGPADIYALSAGGLWRYGPN